MYHCQAKTELLTIFPFDSGVKATRDQQGLTSALSFHLLFSLWTWSHSAVPVSISKTGVLHLHDGKGKSAITKGHHATSTS